MEAAGDCSTLLLDKTGTITLGNRQAAELLTLPGVDERELADAAQLSSLADETPEGRSIVVLAKERYGIRGRELTGATLVPFTAQTRMSGVDVAHDGRRRCIRKGATDAVRRWVQEQGGEVPPALDPIVEGISTSGGTPLAVADGDRILGVVHLKDVVKSGIAERFDELRRLGIRTVMITGDNPLTAKAIAVEAGVDDFLAEATPEDKMALIRKEQEGGRLVAMTGDGTNDAPALAQADVGVAMNTGTQAAKEAGNMVDLDSNPTKLIEIVEIGKQLLITRGSLTTFSIANDVAKYFAIIPAMFVAVYPQLDDLNVMRLDTPESAILSAVIFNALVIVALIPLALRGVMFRATERGVDPPAQPVRLRARRARGAVRRDQGHRPRAGDRGGGLMRNQLTAALRMLLVLTVLTGMAYPLAVTGVGQALFGHEADGSLVERDGRVVGSSLVRQGFSGDEWFHPRPSAAAAGAAGDQRRTERPPTSPTPPRASPTREPPTWGRRTRTCSPPSGNGWPPTATRTGSARTSGSPSTPSPPRARASTRTSPCATPSSRPLGWPGSEASTWASSSTWSEHTSDRDLGVLGERGVNVLELNLALDTQG